MQKFHFIVGENKRVHLNIKSRDKSPFVIQSAEWELKLNDVLESSGECFIKDTIISALICPKKHAVYHLHFMYHIADELLMECVEVVVE